MRLSKPVTVFAVILMVGLLAPSFCFGVLAGGTTAARTTMPGGCHGHTPVPSPAHSCCYAAHALSELTALGISPLASDFAGVKIAIAVHHSDEMAFASDAEFLAPPLQLVLRI